MKRILELEIKINDAKKMKTLERIPKLNELLDEMLVFLEELQDE
ncbi:hypothetical protein [Methanococcus maripaludis]|nr:hypothetical protein [Methanococcus maripaludis]